MYDDMTLDELAKAFVAKSKELEEAKEKATQIQKEYDFLRRVIIPKRMEEAGVDSAKFASIGRGIRIQDEFFVSTRDEQKAKLYEWLRTNGEDAMITETVNSSTLRAYITRRIKEGLDFPSEYVNLSIVPTARFY